MFDFTSARHTGILNDPERGIFCGKCNLLELIATETVELRNSHLEFHSSKHSGVF